MTDYERIIRVKNLECTKLRQVIKELTSKQDSLAAENEDLKEGHDRNCLLENSVQELNQQLGETNTKLQNAEQTLAEFQAKALQLQQNNHKLTKDLAETKKDAATKNDNNCQLIFDLSKLQQENSVLKVQIAKILSEASEKEQNLQKVYQELHATRQQEICLHAEVEELARRIKEVDLQMEKKDSKIAQLLSHLEESRDSLEQQRILEKDIEKLRHENERMRLEIQETDRSRDKLAETLLKNKALLVENKKLQMETKIHLKEKTVLQETNKQREGKINDVSSALEVAQQELSDLKEKNEKFECEYQRVKQMLADTKECLQQKDGLEEMNRLLSIKGKAHAAEMDKLKQSLLDVLNECRELKHKIEDLENRNVHKLNIIAKLKSAENIAVITT